MEIPEQLRNQLFCRVRFKEKRAFEKDWVNKGYNYSTIQQFKGENYGVICGINNLCVLDDDTPDKKLIKIFEENFGETFRVRDHYYFRLKGWDCKKMVLYDEKGVHLGECQGSGSYVVGANSVHPSGEVYDIKNNLPIKDIEFEEFISVFGIYVLKKEKVIREHRKTSWERDDIKDIPISSIISFSGFNDRGNYLQGIHPFHGSTTGMNFSINTSQNTWYCFRCKSGGGSAELIGVMEGIIDCSQSGSNCFTKEEAQEVINIAREKYGLKTPERQEIDIEKEEPKGWANSISIIKMAKRHNFENCPFCNTPFEFVDRLGWWKCSKCRIQGGLTKFANLILQNQNKGKE